MNAPIRLSFPVEAASDLESLLTPKVHTLLQKEGISIKKLQASFDRRGAQPQEILHLHLPGEELRVWVE